MSVPMNRRQFLRRSLAVAAVAAVAPAILVEPFPDSGNGMVFLEAPLERLDGSENLPLYESTWESKTAMEILADINFMLETVWRDSTKMVPDYVNIPEQYMRSVDMSKYDHLLKLEGI